MVQPPQLTTAQVVTIAPPQPQAYGYFGGGAPVADFNGDGSPDLFFGATVGQGVQSLVIAYHYALPSLQPLRTLQSPTPFSQSCGRSGLGGAISVADLDGDGVDDLIFAAPTECPDGSPHRAGRMHIFSGASGQHIRTLRAPVEWFAAAFGLGLANLGDHDGDGLDEFAVGSSDTFSRTVYIYRGNNTLPTFTLSQPNTEEGFGWSMSAIPDLDGDGHADLIVGAYEAFTEAPPPTRPGKAFIYSGATGEQLYWVQSPNPNADYSFGWAVAGLDDLDGDGRGDFIAASYTDMAPDGPPNFGGQVHIFSGATGAVLYTIDAPSPGITSWRFGYSVAATPDLDGDGRQDIAVGAPNGRPDNRPENSGVVYVYSGATGQPLRRLLAPVPVAQAFFGRGLSAIGAPAGSSRRAIMLVNSPYDNQGAVQSGAVYAFYSCRADTDADGRINSRDLTRFLTGWIQTAALPPGELGPPGVHHGDYNADGLVNSADISAFLSAWLTAVAADGCP